MVREILFRGRSLESGEWVYGYFVNCASMYDDPEKDRVAEIIEVDADRLYTGEYDCYHAHEVDPETVSQWTGLVDKNGVKIFEGDVLSVNHLEADSIWEYTSVTGVVEYWSGQFVVEGEENDDYTLICFLYESLPMYREVIGNIWDKEMIKEG